MLRIFILTGVFSPSYFEFQNQGTMMCAILKGDILAFVFSRITCCERSGVLSRAPGEVFCQHSF